MIPRRFAPVLHGLLLSGLMSLVVSGLSTWSAVGLVSGFAVLWAKAWAGAWLVAFPLVIVIGPLARAVAERLTRES